MPIAVCNAICRCSCGIAPSTLTVIPKAPVFVNGLPVASVSDVIPMVNIKSFGMCQTVANPMVAAATAAATAAAFGVFTLVPMPCIPVITSPWISSKPTVMLPTGAVIQGGDKCMCAWGGVIEISIPGQFTVS
ncbi:MAG: DUF4280 domain-containing protein [Alphaproteobacteria bacterium]|nr:DUF4280 domain-containing protein [Alphaproteobacteria bacterium]